MQCVSFNDGSYLTSFLNVYRHAVFQREYYLIILECPYNKYGKDCQKSCTCNFTTGNFVCDNVDGTCSCQEGWKETDCNEDIDECAVMPGDLCVANAHCLNTNGSYSCVCNPGYKMTDNLTCEGNLKGYWHHTLRCICITQMDKLNSAFNVHV